MGDQQQVTLSSSGAGTSGRIVVVLIVVGLVASGCGLLGNDRKLDALLERVEQIPLPGVHKDQSGRRRLREPR